MNDSIKEAYVRAQRIAMQEHIDESMCATDAVSDKQWIFELIDNAIASNANKIRFKFNDDSITFVHDGYPMSIKDVFNILYAQSDRGGTGLGLMALRRICDSYSVTAPVFTGKDGATCNIEFTINREDSTTETINANYDSVNKAFENADEVGKRQLTTFKLLNVRNTAPMLYWMLNSVKIFQCIILFNNRDLCFEIEGFENTMLEIKSVDTRIRDGGNVTYCKFNDGYILRSGRVFGRADVTFIADDTAAQLFNAGKPILGSKLPTSPFIINYSDFAVGNGAVDLAQTVRKDFLRVIDEAVSYYNKAMLWHIDDENDTSLTATVSEV